MSADNRLVGSPDQLRFSYPDSHPLWQDINYTPQFLYQSIQNAKPAEASVPGEQGYSSAPAAVQEKKPSPGAAEGSGGAGEGSDLWTQAEEDLVLYAQSEPGQREDWTLQDVAESLRRSLWSVGLKWKQLSLTPAAATAERLANGAMLAAKLRYRHQSHPARPGQP